MFEQKRLESDKIVFEKTENYCQVSQNYALSEIVCSFLPVSYHVALLVYPLGFPGNNVNAN